MEDFEKMERVEKLRQKTGVTYEEAKNALEACNWDMLDAVVYLEKLGKVNDGGSAYSTQGPVNNAYVQQYRDYENTQQRAKKTFSDYVNDFFNWCAEVFRKGNENFFCVEKGSTQPIKVPITVFVLLLVIGFWAIFILMIIGLFLGFRCSIQGKDMNGRGTDEINSFMDKAADKATDIREDIFDGSNNSDR